MDRVKFVLGVAAGKGGVGKSTLTINLALCLKKLGKSVGIIDADIYGPSMRKMWPEEVLPYRNDAQKIVPAEKEGIKLLSMSHFYDEESAVIVRAPIANSVIKQFFHAVEWGVLDCLLIDFPPGTGDIQLTIMQEGSLSSGVVITTPQEVALQDVRKAVQMFHQMQIPVIGLVENMSYFQDPLSSKRYYPLGRGGGLRLCAQEGIPFLGEVPLDPEITRCCDAGLELDQRSMAVFEQIALQVWEQLEAFEVLEGKYLKKFQLSWR